MGQRYIHTYKLYIHIYIYIYKILEICSPLHFFGQFGRRVIVAFRDGTVVVQRLKHSFVSILWSWNSLYR